MTGPYITQINRATNGKDRWNGIGAGLALKAPVVAVSTGNIDLSGEQTIGAVAVVSPNRVLVVGQTDQTLNGIYCVSTTDWTRATDFDGTRDVVNGTMIVAAVPGSNTNFWELTTANPITIGTSNLTFAVVYDRNVTYGITQAETDAGLIVDIGVMGQVADTSFEPGVVERYGVNAAPGTTDMTLALRAAVEQARFIGAPVYGQGWYMTTDTVDFRPVPVDLYEARIDCNHAGIGIIIAGNENAGTLPNYSGVNAVQKYGSIYRHSAYAGVDSTTTPTVRITGAYGAHIYLRYTVWCQVWVSSDPADTLYRQEFTAYSTFWLNRGDTLELTTNPATTGTLSQPINENTFYLNRWFHFICSGSYGHNSNRFYGGNFESASGGPPSTIDFQVGHSNSWTDLRFESSTDPIEITFGYPTFANRIIETWISSQSQLSNEFIYGNSTHANVTDLGLNTVTPFISQDNNTHIIGRADIADTQLYPQVIYPNILPSLAHVRTDVASGNNRILETERVRVYQGDTFGYYTEYEGVVDPGYRAVILCYDIDGNPYTPISDQVTLPKGGNITDFITSSFTGTIVGNVINMTTTNDWGYILLANANIAWVQIRIFSTTLSQMTGRSVSAYVRRPNRDDISSIRNCLPDMKIKHSSPHAVTGTPTKGYAPVGYTAINLTTKALYIVARSIDTVTTAASAGGTNTVTLADVTGIANGDIIGILNDDKTVTDWDVVLGAPAGFVVTLTGVLTGNVAIGNRVVSLFWA